MELSTKQLIMAIRQIAEEKNLSEEVVQDVVEQALAAAFRKDFGDKEQEVRAQMNVNTGDVTVYVSKEVVEEVEDPTMQLSLKDAQVMQKNAKLGDFIEVIEKPETFGRVAAQTAKQVILQKLREAEREIVLAEFEDKIGTIINGTVQRVEARLVRVDLGRTSGILPASEQIQGEYYGTGARIKVFLKDVERTTRGPQLILSRAAPEFIELLFRNEVPEMDNGAVEIKRIAREAGVRTKIAVASTVPGVDPVGTFVGGHGTRVQAVMSEIGDQEKIDIIPYSDDPVTFITSALAPTTVTEVKLDKKGEKATVYVADDQLSVAIGKNGQNVRLASKLSGHEIDIESADNRGVSRKTEKAAAPAEEAAASKPVAKARPASASNRPKRKSDIENALLSAIEEHGEDSSSDSEDKAEEA